VQVIHNDEGNGGTTNHVYRYDEKNAEWSIHHGEMHTGEYYPGPRMLTVKRVALFLFELLIEALLLGGFMGILVSYQTGLLNGMIGSMLAIPVVLTLYGYYISRMLSVIARTRSTTWLYPFVASSVFVAHVWYAFWRMKSALSPFAQSLRMPFLIGGACIVFVCASTGTIALRRWASAHSKLADA
jgi:hypothetical protein